MVQLKSKINLESTNLIEKRGSNLKLELLNYIQGYLNPTLWKFSI